VLQLTSQPERLQPLVDELGERPGQFDPLGLGSDYRRFTWVVDRTLAPFMAVRGREEDSGQRTIGITGGQLEQIIRPEQDTLIGRPSPVFGEVGPQASIEGPHPFLSLLGVVGHGVLQLGTLASAFPVSQRFGGRCPVVVVEQSTRGARS
jgi:hypothetical protein